MNEAIKKNVRSWLNIQDAGAQMINITELLDYEGNAAKNRIWYRGVSYELSQLYEQIAQGNDARKFWASKGSTGREMRKLHTGLPALIVDVLTRVTLSDMKINLPDGPSNDIWQQIEKDNNFRKMIEKAVKETLYIGDGAFKISFDPAIGSLPIIEYFPGDRVEISVKRGRIREVIFKTAYVEKGITYVLHEHYGYGYITYTLMQGDREVELDRLEETKDLTGYEFGPKEQSEKYMLAVPIRIYESAKWEDRGESIFDRKVDAFDALDECWSQWMEAIRAGRASRYIPENLIPRDPETGALMQPNPFDNQFVITAADLSEGAVNKIQVEQPAIPHDSYQATYISALDLCLQGLISPSTLGIDVKKLDNAEAQREKEKTTLYSRNSIIDALQLDIPRLVEAAVKAYHELRHEPVEAVEATIEFGDYANPSFESQVETIGKAKQNGIMSIETSVDELYGDDKPQEWKDEEVARLKAEQGIAELEEPAVNEELGGFRIGIQPENIQEEASEEI